MRFKQRCIFMRHDIQIENLVIKALKPDKVLRVERNLKEAKGLANATAVADPCNKGMGFTSPCRHGLHDRGDTPIGMNNPWSLHFETRILLMQGVFQG